MTLTYGFVKARVKSVVGLKGSRHGNEIQYHMHLTLDVADGDWDVAINVGTNDADDLLEYKLAYDYHHPITEILSQSTAGFHDLTGQTALPALDFIRSDVLAETGQWRTSDVMDGSYKPEPVASILRLVRRAKDDGLDLYLFGRRYAHDGNGIHDTHMNQGSQRAFIHRGGDDSNDHNDIWQDGALLIDLREQGWAYFAAFEQQLVPTDDLGNPEAGAKRIAQ